MKKTIITMLSCLSIHAMEQDRSIKDDFFTDPRATITITHPSIKDGQCIVCVEASFGGQIRDQIEIVPDQTVKLVHNDKGHFSNNLYMMMILVGETVYSETFLDPSPIPYILLSDVEKSTQDQGDKCVVFKKRKWKRPDDTFYVERGSNLFLYRIIVKKPFDKKKDKYSRSPLYKDRISY